MNTHFHLYVIYIYKYLSKLICSWIFNNIFLFPAYIAYITFTTFAKGLEKLLLIICSINFLLKQKMCTPIQLTWSAYKVNNF